MKLFIDIETLPTNVKWIQDEIHDSISPPANYKKPESIKQWMDLHGVDAYQDSLLKTSFDGSSGRICCIGIAIDDQEPKAFYGEPETPDDEWMIMKDFFTFMESYCFQNENCGPNVASIEWIGHNLTGFDLRFLYQRCVIHNVNTYGLRIPIDDRHGKGRVFDTLTAWKGFGTKAGGSMDRLCKLLGIQGKGDITGADVWPMYQEGKILEIAEYCKQDVERTRQIYKRLNLH